MTEAENLKSVGRVGTVFLDNRKADLFHKTLYMARRLTAFIGIEVNRKSGIKVQRRRVYGVL